MSATRTSALGLVVAAALLVTGALLWLNHAKAWDLGGRSPVLGYDAAQYAVAARELAEHGRLATPFALPIELSRHATPPWPLALVQPGLVLAEAVLFKLGSLALAGNASAAVASRRIEWLALVLPLLCYLATGLLLALATMRLLEVHAHGLTPRIRAAAAFAAGLLFLLDPEAQHFATGGFTELPFVLGLAIAVVALAFGFASRRPFVYGLILGATGLFRGNMLWLAPILAIAAASADAAPGRLSRFARVLVGYAAVLAPWWIYKWIAFGSPAHDLSALSLWIGIEGRTWFSINHLPEPLEMPSGWTALAAISGKLTTHIPRLMLDLATGLRPLWLGSILIWTFVARPPRMLTAASFAILAIMAVSVVATAASDPILRYLFPARVLLEVAGLGALWMLIARVPSAAAARRALQVVVAVIAIGWGGWMTLRLTGESRAVSERRGTPSSATIAQLAEQLDAVVPASEPVMSNLGPLLSWYTSRPVVHLALTPDDVAACRRYTDFRHVLLVFRNAERAWPGWGVVIERPLEATRNAEWGIHQARAFETSDGFRVVWLELDPLVPAMASASVAGRSRHPSTRSGPKILLDALER